MDIDIQKLKDDIFNLMEKHPDNYIFMLHAKCYKDTYGKYVDYINEVTKEHLSDPKYTFKTKLYWVLHDIKDFPICEQCNEPILRNVQSGITGYSGGGRYCSVTCARRTQEYKDKMKSIARQKYGSDYIITSKSVQKKIRESVKKAINDNPDYYKERQKKTRKTCLERYGVEHPQQNKEIRGKTLETFKKNNIEKYGVEFPLQSKQIMDKIKASNMEKYGTEFPLQNQEYQSQICKMANSEESKQKRLATALKKYGVTNLFHIGKEKAAVSIHRNSYEHLFSTTTIPMFSFDDYLKYIKNGEETELEWMCTECEKRFSMVPFKHYYNGSWVRCLKCHPYINFGYSNGEKDVLEYVKTILPDEIVKENDNTILRSTKTGRPLEIDIWIPERKIAIEYQGEYWHKKETAMKNDVIKYQICKNLGIRLLQLDEVLWVQDKQKAKAMIKDFIENETA